MTGLASFEVAQTSSEDDMKSRTLMVLICFEDVSIPDSGNPSKENDPKILRMWCQGQTIPVRQSQLFKKSPLFKWNFVKI